ncbi:MAG: substrate-binding domain-containing protein, partial [Nanopusillaceae archaeon]
KEGIKPNLILSEDTYILEVNKIKTMRLALDPIVIVYSKNIKFTDSNWIQTLSKLNYGFSNPDSDPLGYYVHFIFSLYNKINKTNYICKSKYLRDETTDLFWLMKSGNLDAIFTYKSFAVQNHLKYFELPKPYNLADAKFNYSVVSYKLSNGKVIPGHVSSFGMGIIEDNKETKDFIKYIFSKSNSKYFDNLGLIMPQ